MFGEEIVALCLSVVEFFYGINLNDFLKILKNQKTVDSDALEISQNLDKVKLQLEDSKRTIDDALNKMDEQKKLFEQMKRDAAISEQIQSLNHEQVEALSKELEKTLDKQDKKSFPKNFLWNMFFCVLSALIGFYLGKHF